MADTTGMDWQRQSFAKGGKAEAAPCQMAEKVYPQGMTASMNKKIATPSHGLGGLVSASMKKMANGGMVRGYAHGGEVTEASDKAAGLKASAGEEVGFFKRLAMGNIDQEGSEAYNKFGAGRGAAERVKALPDDGSNDVAESKRLGMSKAEAPEPAKTTPLEMPEPIKATAADFQRTDKDTTPVATPAKSKPASAPKAADISPKADPSTSVVRIKPNTAKDAFDPAPVSFAGRKPEKTAARTIKTKSEMLGSSKAR